MDSFFGVELSRLLVHLKSGCILEALLRVGWPGQEGRRFVPEEDLQRASRVLHVFGLSSRFLFYANSSWLLC